MQLFGGIYAALCSVPLKVFVCFLFHGCFVWQVLFLWCLIGCVGLFSLTFCISFSNALLAVGFVVLLLLSSSASILTGRAVLQMFVAFLLLHLLLGLVGACSPSLDFFFFVLHEGCSCFCSFFLGAAFPFSKSLAVPCCWLDAGGSRLSPCACLLLIAPLLVVGALCMAHAIWIHFLLL